MTSSTLSSHALLCRRVLQKQPTQQLLLRTRLRGLHACGPGVPPANWSWCPPRPRAAQPGRCGCQGSLGRPPRRRLQARRWQRRRFLGGTSCRQRGGCPNLVRTLGEHVPGRATARLSGVEAFAMKLCFQQHGQCPRAVRVRRAFRRGRASQGPRQRRRIDDRCIPRPLLHSGPSFGHAVPAMGDCRCGQCINSAWRPSWGLVRRVVPLEQW